MRLIATHIVVLPNPAQLEMRVLANNGTDPRFVFLRGCCSRAWRFTKGKARLELEAAEGGGREGVGKGHSQYRRPR